MASVGVCVGVCLCVSGRCNCDPQNEVASAGASGSQAAPFEVRRNFIKSTHWLLKPQLRVAHVCKCGCSTFVWVLQFGWTFYGSVAGCGTPHSPTVPKNQHKRSPYRTFPNMFGILAAPAWMLQKEQNILNKYIDAAIVICESCGVCTHRDCTIVGALSFVKNIWFIYITSISSIY